VALTRSGTREWTLGVVAVSCGLHVIDEYVTGWQSWAVPTFGIVMPTTWFFVMNSVLVAIALRAASLGWRSPTFSLVIPAATLVNAVFFHILPTLLQGRLAPGLSTACLLYLPFSTWAIVGAIRDGVPRRAVALAMAGGTVMMISVVLGARWLSGLGRS
jgi:uncharacterized protein with HXXEE motif